MFWTVVLPAVVVLVSGQNTTEVAAPNYIQSGEDWGGFCFAGQLQSPLDLTSAVLQFEDDFVFSALFPSYSSFQPTYHFTSTDYRILGSFGQLSLQSVDSASTEIFTADFISFHAPSEHRIQGHQFALEMQIRHSFVSAPQGLNSREANSSYAIVSVLYDLGAENDFLNDVLSNSPQLDLLSAFPDGQISNYYLYEGSETFYPCEENVRWAVWAQPQQLSADQLTFFRSKWEDSLSFARGNGNNREIVGTSEDRKVLRVLK